MRKPKRVANEAQNTYLREEAVIWLAKMNLKEFSKDGHSQESTGPEALNCTVMQKEGFFCHSDNAFFCNLYTKAFSECCPLHLHFISSFTLILKLLKIAQIFY